MPEEANHELLNEEETPGTVPEASEEDGQPPASQTPRLRPLSRRKLAANRRNALKSTGPRTAAGKLRAASNSIKHGRYAGARLSYAQSLRTSMMELGEDPDEFERIREALARSCSPSTEEEEMLVDDLASLRWQRRRLERAQAALLARRLQDLDVEHQLKSLEVSKAIIARIPASQLRLGLIWEAESPTNYQKLLELLDELKTRLAVGEFTDIETPLGWIYGPNPTTRGALIQGLFLLLSQGKAKKSSIEGHRRNLAREIEAEISSITQQYQLYIRKNVEVTPAMRDECLAPTADQRWLNREMNQIDRQIERKTLLLRRIREAARTAGAHETSALSADQSSLEEKEGEGEIAQKIVEADEPINI